MFPLPWNKAYRKKDGSLTTIDDAIENGGGQYELPTASSSTKGGVKIGSGLTMDGEVLKNSNPTPYSLPTASAEVLGGIKVGSGLSIEDGVLSALGGASTKVYFKEFNGSWRANVALAAIDNGSAVSAGVNLASWNNDGSANPPNINISGYTPIAAIAKDNYTGYQYAVMIQYFKSSGTVTAYPTFAISGRTIDNNSCGLRVYYVKNEDLQELT